MGLACAAIAAGVTTLFYFKRVWVNDDLLIALASIQWISLILAAFFGVISSRSWQGLATLALTIIIMIAAANIVVGIH